MKKQQPRFLDALLLPGLLAISAATATAQQTIGRTTATEIKVSGAVDIEHGETLLGNGSDVTAGDQAVKIALERGGSLQLCSTSNVYLARDGSVDDRSSSALMMALGRGAMEASYTVGRYSDVLMTPDLRILVSGPGEAHLSVRVNTRGDTCIDNHGADAPYVTVSSQFEGGAYRIMPNQRVTFQHGSLLEVVDHEPEPCGCPKAAALPQVATAQAAVGGPSSTPADTAFPVAESEGLAPPSKPPPTPVVPAGQAHAQVTVPLVYSGENQPAAPPAAAAKKPVDAAPPMAVTPAPPPVLPAPAPTAPETVPQPAGVPGQPPGGGNIFHSIGHFFSRIFRK